MKSESILTAHDNLGHGGALTDDSDQGALTNAAMKALNMVHQCLVESVALQEQVT